MFLSPLLLLGLLATAIPLVLHLRRSTKAKKITFSTTRFFDEQFIRSSRRARFQDFFLMLLRILLLVLFVLALAQPLLKFPNLAALAGGKRTVAIVIDDSASMGVTEDQGSMLDRAKRGAILLLDDLSVARGDRVTVVLAGRREDGVKSLFAEPTSDFASVRSAISAIRLTDLATDLNGAIEAASHTIGGDLAGGATTGNKEIYVFSDLQESAFAPSDPIDPGPGVGLLMVSTRSDGRASRDNVSVDAIQYGAPQPMIGVPFAFRTLVTNHSDAARTVSVSLIIDDASGAASGHAALPAVQKVVDLPAGRSRIVRFVHRFTKPGWFSGRVEVGPPPADAQNTSAAPRDSLAVDNQRHFALKVEESVKLLAINGAPSAVAARDELFFFRLALTSTPQSGSRATRDAGSIRIIEKQSAGVPFVDDTAQSGSPISAADLARLDLSNIPLIVMANVVDLSAGSLEALEKYVDGGGSLLISLGDRVDPKAYNTWLGENRLHGGLLPGRITDLVGSTQPATDTATPDAGFIASVADEHPALAGFADGQFGNLSAVRFTARWGLDAPADSVLMRAPNGDAILAEKRFGRGRVMLFTSSLDRDWNNFPLQASYVPWLYRLVGYLAQNSLAGANFVRTGQVVDLPASATQVEALQVETPDGTIEYPQPGKSTTAGDNASAMELAGVEHAGIYKVRSALAKTSDPPRLLLAANVPSEESEAGVLDDTGVKDHMAAGAAWAFVDAPESTVEAGQLARRGFGVWDQLLFVALLVGLFEPWLANRLSRRRAQSSPDALAQRDSLTRAEISPDASKSPADLRQSA